MTKILDISFEKNGYLSHIRYGSREFTPNITIINDAVLKLFTEGIIDVDEKNLIILRKDNSIHVGEFRKNYDIKLCSECMFYKYYESINNAESYCRYARCYFTNDNGQNYYSCIKQNKNNSLIYVSKLKRSLTDNYLIIDIRHETE